MESSTTNIVELSRPLDPLVTEKEVSLLLNLTPQCLQAWRQNGEGPPFIRISARCIRYRRSDVEAWIADGLCSSTSDLGRSEVQ